MNGAFNLNLVLLSLHSYILEAVAAVAAFKLPNPYLPLSNRLEQFLTNHLFLRAKSILEAKPSSKTNVRRRRCRLNNIRLTVFV